MNEKELGLLSDLLSPLTALENQSEKFTYRSQTSDLLQTEGEIVMAGEPDEDGEPCALYAKVKADKDRAEPPILSIRVDGQVGWTFADWDAFKKKVDASFLLIDDQLLSYVDEGVLQAVRDRKMKIKEAMEKAYRKAYDKATGIKSILNDAEEMFFPEGKRPFGPLFGDAPIDEADMAPLPAESVTYHPVEIYKGEKVRDPEGLGHAVFFTNNNDIAYGPWWMKYDEELGSHLVATGGGEAPFKQLLIWRDKATSCTNLRVFDDDGFYDAGSKEFIELFREEFRRPEHQWGAEPVKKFNKKKVQDPVELGYVIAGAQYYNLFDDAPWQYMHTDDDGSHLEITTNEGEPDEGFFLMVYNDEEDDLEFHVGDSEGTGQRTLPEFRKLLREMFPKQAAELEEAPSTEELTGELDEMAAEVEEELEEARG